jgi:hypothetical protein
MALVASFGCLLGAYSGVFRQCLFFKYLRFFSLEDGRALTGVRMLASDSRDALKSGRRGNHGPQTCQGSPMAEDENNLHTKSDAVGREPKFLSFIG